MLARVAGWLKPGGRLVYSVCSLERQEGEQVVDAFLEPARRLSRSPEEHRLLPGRYRGGRRRRQLLHRPIRLGSQAADNRG